MQQTPVCRSYMGKGEELGTGESKQIHFFCRSKFFRFWAKKHTPNSEPEDAMRFTLLPSWQKHPLDLQVTFASFSAEN